MKKFREAQLEQAFIALLGEQGIPHQKGKDIARAEEEVLIRDDLKAFLRQQYQADKLTDLEADQIIKRLESLSSVDLYESNKAIMKMISDGFALKREDRSQKDVWIYLIDYTIANKNNYKIVSQLEITGQHKRIPDGILYINGIPLVVFEFKTVIEEDITIHQAYKQLSVRYRQDIPALFKYNAFCVISDGANTKAGSFFADYEFYYAWRKVEGVKGEKVGIDSMLSLIQGMFHQERLLDIIRNFIFIPDRSNREEKIVCRYPQYYATRKLYHNIIKRQKPEGDGKGGTYFGTTGCGKSYTMLFLTRLLMKSTAMESPTIVLITDRTDLDDQLSGQFTNAKGFIGDNVVKTVTSRADLRAQMKGRNSGGVFLTTIHKFNEDTELLTSRTNVVCISDEAHRSQTNLKQKIKTTNKGVKKSFGFAKHLHDSLPNATYVGFTGTPVDATLDVFGDIVDSYTMTESVRDEITVSIVYEGRAAIMSLNNRVMEEVEAYYKSAAAEGASEYHIDKSKEESSKLNVVLSDPDRLADIAKDFVNHYETRMAEGSTVKGKAMFVCSTRPIAFDFYCQVQKLLKQRTTYHPSIGNTDPSLQMDDFKPSLDNTTKASRTTRNTKYTKFTPHKLASEDSVEYNSTPQKGSKTNDSDQPSVMRYGMPEEWQNSILPESNKDERINFITIRLGDSLPQEVLDKLPVLPLGSDDEGYERFQREKERVLYEYLDQGLGCCALAHKEMAQVTLDALRYHDGDLYQLLAWSIKSNYVHVLIQTEEKLSTIVELWKNKTEKWAIKNNKKYKFKLPDKPIKFWDEAFSDLTISDSSHFNEVVQYILRNPSNSDLSSDHFASDLTGCTLTQNSRKRLQPSQIKMIMTKDKNDLKEMRAVLGDKAYRKDLERQFKDEKSNFKVAIVVDMWLTGFDVPFLDTMYLDKPIKNHNLIQTISRVNRKYAGKGKGLIVDYIGIKKEMNLALAIYSTAKIMNIEDISRSIVVVKDHLDLLKSFFHGFESKDYFYGDSVAQLGCLKRASEFAMKTEVGKKRFMDIVKRLKAAYDICCGSRELDQVQKDHIHYYLAIRSIIFKLTKGDAPDTAQMNSIVREKVAAALQSEGIEEIIKLGEEEHHKQDLFDQDYLANINKLKLPHTKIQLLQKLLSKAIGELKKINKMQGIEFSKKMKAVVAKYNERKDDLYPGEEFGVIVDELTNLILDLKDEFETGNELGIDIEEKAFYDILRMMAEKYNFSYPHEKLLYLAKEVKLIVDDKAKYPDWSAKNDIKAELEANLIVLLGDNGYPPVAQDEVYKAIFEQAENFKKNKQN